jgi:hypothetical protein
LVRRLSARAPVKDTGAAPDVPAQRAFSGETG